jgi:hypothetical protein
MILGLLVASGIAIVLRYRRSDATTRRQIRWLAAGRAAAGRALCRHHRRRDRDPGARHHRDGRGGRPGGIALVPVSVAIAILRHRLFDIDLVLNRTIVFGLLAAFITSLYVAIVVGVGTMVGDPRTWPDGRCDRAGRGRVRAGARPRAALGERRDLRAASHALRGALDDRR